jgi:putative SOS response-associated peptidase YedK
MCGRFTLRTPMSKVVEQFHLPLLDDALTPRYNIAPTQAVAAVRSSPATQIRELVMLKWGLVPAWADDPTIGNRMINARSETAAVKPAFRSAMRQRRCLVPADGFFEWQTLGRKKQPHYFTLRDGGLFAIAGLWETWRHQELVIESCTLLTTEANPLVRPLHDRMPVIVPPEAYDRWLDPLIDDAEKLEPLLRPYPAEEMAVRPVNPIVNSPAQDDPRCIDPPAQQSLFD